jgi:hypothetical protein
MLRLSWTFLSIKNKRYKKWTVVSYKNNDKDNLLASLGFKTRNLYHLSLHFSILNQFCLTSMSGVIRYLPLFFIRVKDINWISLPSSLYFIFFLKWISGCLFFLLVWSQVLLQPDLLSVYHFHIIELQFVHIKITISCELVSILPKRLSLVLS